MAYFLRLVDSDFIGYGFLLVVGILVYLYARMKRWFGTELNYFGDDVDSDGYFFWGDSADDGDSGGDN